MEKQSIRNVLVKVDVQNDFIDGTLAVKNGVEVVAPLNDVGDAVRASDGTVVLSGDQHPEVTPHFQEYGGLWPEHCVAGTRGAAFHPELDVQDGDIILNKGMGQTDGYSAIEGISATGDTLQSIITPESTKEKVRVFIGGLATDYCVKATAVDIATVFADDKRVNVYALRDAMRAVNINPSDETRAVEAMAEAGVKIITVADALAMIDEGRLER
jgi:nicotinamidase/pyrazinamidase